MKTKLPAITEKAFQAQVVKLAALCGWRVYHTFDSRRSNAGFPDLCLVRQGRIVFIELKTDRGQVRPEQELWLSALRATAAEAYLFRPRDFDDIVRTLA